MRRQIVATLTVLFFLSIASTPTAAHAALQRVGPTVPANGYPSWFQDSTGLVMDFCSPQTQGELVDGWCLLLQPDVPLGTAPEVFPTNFSEEHFYWSGSSAVALPDYVDPVTGVASANRALLVLAIEAAFASGPVIAGDQMTFGRIRVVVKSLPVSGTYTVYHPFGVLVFSDQVAGDRLFFTEDIGFNCAPGTFDCTLATAIGPYLLPSVTPGGPELPPIPLLQPGQDPYTDALAPGPTAYPGNPLTQTPKYIADPARIGPVTGSPLPPFVSAVDGVTRNHNMFRIEVVPTGATTPIVIGESQDFSLQGRIFEGAIPAHVTVDRASYTVPVAASATAGQLDVYATAFPSISPRVPAGALPVVGASPLLMFFDGPCVLDPATGAAIGPPVGDVPHQMVSSGSDYWGQSPPCDIDPITGQVIIPAQACVAQTNAVGAGGGVVSIYFPVNVTDEVTVSEALFDPATTSLTVAASSSDLVDPPTLNLIDFGTLTAGTWTSTQLPPPATVQVVSTALRPLAFGSKGGIGEMQVATGVGAVQAPAVPVAANDIGTTVEDSPLPAIDVLGNDRYQNLPIVFGPGVTVTLVAGPRLGSAAVNPDGTVSYTPAPNAFGTDGFSYQVSVLDATGVTLTSNIAGISVFITPVNDAPVAANDTAGGIVNIAAAIDVFVNDTDPDGAVDLGAAVNFVQTSGPALATITGGAGGVVSFLAPVAGTYTFTYQVQDNGGGVTPVVPLLSNLATVTVTIAGAETLIITPPVEYRATAARWVIAGTDTPPANQLLTITYADGPNAGFVIGTATVDALGNWLFDVRGVTGLFNPTLAQATAITVTGPAGGVATAPITIR